MSSFLGRQFYRSTLYNDKLDLALNNSQELICRKTPTIRMTDAKMKD